MINKTKERFQRYSIIKQSLRKLLLCIILTWNRCTEQIATEKSMIPVDSYKTVVSVNDTQFAQHSRMSVCETVCFIYLRPCHPLIHIINHQPP